MRPPVHITMVSLAGRENLTSKVIWSLNGRGGGLELQQLFNLHYFATADIETPIVPRNWKVHQRPPFVKIGGYSPVRGGGRHPDNGMMPDFWSILKTIPDDQDWIFLEDDITPCKNAIRKMVEVQIPDDVGLLSFFDLRNQWFKPGIWRNLVEQHLYGTQALKVSRRFIPEIKRMGREQAAGLVKDRWSQNWDLWLGFAVQRCNGAPRVAHYVPSLVQHIGMISMAYPDSVEQRPLAHNFPGEKFDAMKECPYPIPQGEWTEEFLVARPCNLHGGETHPYGFLCPQICG